MFNKFITERVGLLLAYIVYSIMMCFRCFEAAAGGGGAAAPVVDPPVVDPNEITIENLKGIILEAVKTSTAEEMKELKKDMTEVTRKSIFPFQDGKFGTGEVADVTQQSILDTTFFSKQYSMNSQQFSKYKSMQAPWLPEGMLLGNELKNQGSPWKRLSPEMETFAKSMQCMGNMDKMRQVGIDVKDHNDKVIDHMKQSGMNEGVLGAGGVFVPVEFWNGCIEFAIQQSVILSKVWRLQMNSNLMYLPRLVQAAGAYFGGVQFFTPGEGQKKEDTQPEFERLTLQAEKLIAVVYLTDELIADSMINIVNYVTGLFTRAFQYELERRVIAGAGTAGTPCLGIVNDPLINLVPRQTAGTVTYQDIINLDNALDENFTNLSWATRKVTQNTLLGLRDSHNRPIFMADYGVFTGSPLHPPTMITYPVNRTRNVPTMGTKGDLILGDLSWYLLGIRQDLRIDQSEHVRFLWDEQTIRFVMRLDGLPAISIAFAILDDVES